MQQNFWLRIQVYNGFITQSAMWFRETEFFRKNSVSISAFFVRERTRTTLYYKPYPRQNMSVIGRFCNFLGAYHIFLPSPIYAILPPIKHC